MDKQDLKGSFKLLCIFNKKVCYEKVYIFSIDSTDMTRKREGSFFFIRPNLRKVIEEWD